MRVPSPPVDRGWSYLFLTHPLVVAISLTSFSLIADRYQWASPKCQLLLMICAAGLIACVRWPRAQLAAVFYVSLLAAASGLGHHHAWWYVYPDSDLGWQVPHATTTGTITGILTFEPQVKKIAPTQHGGYPISEATTRLQVQVQSLALPNSELAQSPRVVTGHVDCYVRGVWQQATAGASVRICGKLQPIAAPTNPGQFHFQDFYRSKRQRVVMFAPSIDSVEEIPGPRRWLAPLRARWRSQFDQALSNYLSPRAADIASAMLLGNRHRLSDAAQDQFVYTGTAHVLAISGLHVGILANLFFWLLRLGWLPRSYCLILVMAWVTLYAWLVDFNPPVTRATILINLFCISRLIGRPGLSFNLLSLAGLLVLCVNPSDLFNTGPQLSFLAVAGLIAITPKYSELTPRSPLRRLWLSSRTSWFRQVMSYGRLALSSCQTSTQLWILTTPLIANRFHLVSWGGLVANPLVIPLMTGVLSGGLVVMLVGDHCPTIASLAAVVCGGSITAIDGILSFILNFSCSSQWVIGPSSPALLVFLGLFWGLVVCPYAFTQMYQLGTTQLGRVVGVAADNRCPTAAATGPQIAPPQTQHVSWIRPWTVFMRPSSTPTAILRPSTPVLVGVLLVWWLSAWIVPNHYRWQQQRRIIDFAELTFIDVGHGTSVLIRSPGGKLILYDAGRFGAAEAAGQTIAGVLWSLGIMRLDAVIVSHADVDHYNALPDLCLKFHISTVYMSPPMYRQSQPSVDALKQQLQQCRIPVRTMAQGDRLQLDPDTTLHVLSPPETGTGGDDNSDSIVLLAELGTTRVLLPGDLDGPGLQQQLKHEIEPVDLAMAPHHGSLSCSPERFVAWCGADWIVISGDRRRLSERSLTAYQQTGAQVIATAHGGALRFRLRPREITCQTWIAGWE